MVKKSIVDLAAAASLLLLLLVVLMARETGAKIAQQQKRKGRKLLCRDFRKRFNGLAKVVAGATFISSTGPEDDVLNVRHQQRTIGLLVEMERGFLDYFFSIIAAEADLTMTE